MGNQYDAIVPVLSKNIAYNKFTESEYVLSNKVHRHYLKINSAVYAVLKEVDGLKNMKQIAEAFHEIYNKSITVDELYKLLHQTLAPYGVLEGFENAIKGYEKPYYLALSFVILPESVVHRITRHLHFLFNRTSVIIILGICLVITILMLTLNFDLYTAFNLRESLVYFFVTMAISVTFHEIGHATAAGYFGARHGGIGGGFYLFTPVYYADVTDIWRLTRKQRIVVNLAGMYFECIFCSLLALTSYLAGNTTLLIVSLIVCLHTLFNLNPFLRSDGYWVLSDLTNQPNLIYHATQKIPEVYRFIFQKKSIRWNGIDILLLLYGLMSFSMIGMFVYYILIENPSSILHFPQNAVDFVNSIFVSSSQFSIIKYSELIAPLIFFMLFVKVSMAFIKKRMAASS
ncbi:MAG: peptidase, M50 family protein [Maribacter sp.]|nr:peptidase, M50 family protein [Maribacter sp.]